MFECLKDSIQIKCDIPYVISDFDLPAMPVAQITDLAESNTVYPTLSRNGQVRCMAGGYSDFELNISIFTGGAKYKNIFRQKKQNPVLELLKELSYSASQADHAYNMLFEGLELAIGQ